MKNKYGIKVTETLERTYIVEAESYEEAEATIEKAYSKGDIILLDDDISSHEIGSSIVFGKKPISSDDDRLDLYDKFYE